MVPVKNEVVSSASCRIAVVVCELLTRIWTLGGRNNCSVVASKSVSGDNMWDIVINFSGPPLSKADIRFCFRSKILRETLDAHKLKTRDNMFHYKSEVSSFRAFVRQGKVKLQSAPAESQVFFGNELCISLCGHYGPHDSTLFLEILLFKEWLGDYIRMRVFSENIDVTPHYEKHLCVTKSLRIRSFSALHISALLIPHTPLSGCVSMSFFNGTFPMMAQPMVEMVQHVMRGLQDGKANVALRVERDPYFAWRFLGEYRLKSRTHIHQQYQLVIHVKMIDKNNACLDGVDAEGMENLWMNLAKKTSSALSKCITVIDRQAKESQTITKIHDEYADKIASDLSCVFQRGRPEFLTRVQSILDNLRHHGETTEQTISRSIKEMYDK